MARARKKRIVGAERTVRTSAHIQGLIPARALS
jgi:hypothetical protein